MKKKDELEIIIKPPPKIDPNKPLTILTMIELLSQIYKKWGNLPVADIYDNDWGLVYSEQFQVKSPPYFEIDVDAHKNYLVIFES